MIPHITSMYICAKLAFVLFIRYSKYLLLTYSKRYKNKNYKIYYYYSQHKSITQYIKIFKRLKRHIHTHTSIINCNLIFHNLTQSYFLYNIRVLMSVWCRLVCYTGTNDIIELPLF